MRWLVVAACFLSLNLAAANGQESRIVRKWQGTLGSSQFGVFSKDGSRLVYTSGNDVIIVDSETGENEVKLSGHEKPVWLARFSGDDKRIVSVGQDDSIRVWDTETNKTLSVFEANTFDRCSVLVPSKDAKLFAFSSGENRQMKFINTLKGVEVQRIGLTEAQVGWSCVTPDLKLAMSGGIRNDMTIWDANTGTAVDLENGHHNYCGQFTHDGTHALLGGGFSWDLWDVRRKTRIKAGTVTGGHVYAVATSPNTSRFLTGLADGTVWLWDIKSAKELAVLRGHTKPLEAAMISPDKKLAVTRDQGGEIILWRLPK